MVVQHNLTAMNSNRMLGLTTSSQAKSTERLSSGYKINRAADDASGLSISEKMRKQIRGLTQASSNAQDGISSVQTAEGALTEVHDMLQRMNELAVKAANGTNSETDRSYIQSELDQLVTEIDRVSTTTKFNEIYLLKGTNADGSVAKLTYETANESLSNILDEFDTATGKGTLAIDTDAGEVEASSGGTAGSYAQKTVEIDGKRFTFMSDFVSSTNADGEDEYTLADYKQKLIDDAAAEDPVVELKVFDTEDAWLTAVKGAMNEAAPGDVKSVSLGKNSDGDYELTVEAFADLNDGLDVSLHVGADSTDDNKIGLNISMMSARGLGVNGLRIDGETTDNATAAIDTITAAIQKVSSQRSTLGAVQNRLEHTVNNLDNIVENTTSAESQIRDTDMATEMVKYANNNILAQAGQSMLAQANQSNQGVLSLLG